MKIVFISLAILLFLAGCAPGRHSNRKALPWIIFSKFPMDSMSRITGPASWTAPSRPFATAADTFVVYPNNDSIRMIIPGNDKLYIFASVKIYAKWKPRPDYGHKLFLLGTYQRRDQRGVFACFYAARDWSSYLQVWYTNPGNLTDVTLFSRDSVNILQKEHIVIDPKDEQPEPERIQINVSGDSLVR